MVIANHPIIAKAHTNIALVKYWGKLDKSTDYSAKTTVYQLLLMSSTHRLSR